MWINRKQYEQLQSDLQAAIAREQALQSEIATLRSEAAAQQAPSPKGSATAITCWP
jgi:predicted  nucleic acid-binding Zn-ribbon protein